MSKRKNKNQRYQHTEAMHNHFELRKISPLTPNQEKVYSFYEHGYNLVLHGYAGTGKTFISLYLALKEILESRSSYDKIIIIRSVVPSRDIGFLPGSLKEKIKVYEEPYKEICDNLFGRGDGYDILKMKNIINFTSTSFLRGITLNNAIVIIDEVQNLEHHELYTTLTRIGDNSKLIICGDFRQSDLKYPKYFSNQKDLSHTMNILRQIPTCRHIEFEKQDIVRSGFVKDFIIKSTEYFDKLGMVV